MSVPTLVIHGIGNHDVVDVRHRVMQLQSKLPHRELILVEWGDLGGIAAGLEDTIPVFSGAGRTSEIRSVDRAEDFGPLLLGDTSLETRDVNFSTDAQVAAGIARAALEGSATGASVVRQHVSSELQAALEEALPHTHYLRYLLSGDAQDAAGRLLGYGLRQSTDSNVRGFPRAVAETVALFIGDLDRFAGLTVSESAGGFLSWVRTSTRQALAESAGDILAYLSHRDAVHARLLERLAASAPGWGGVDQPIDVVAHSLGGLIALDAAVNPASCTCKPLHIRKLVTFGSQPAFFHVLAPREGLQAYAPPFPTQLPDRIGTWANLWHPLDPLSFTAGKVFRLHNGRGPEDIRIDTALSQVITHKAWLHSIYWGNPGLSRALSD